MSFETTYSLDHFNNDLKKFLQKRKLDRFVLKYKRPCEPIPLILWCQENLDRLGIIEIEYELKNRELITRNIVHDYMGEPIFPYNISYLDNCNSPEEIESINLKLERYQCEL
jgi:hypothetical protein